MIAKNEREGVLCRRAGLDDAFVAVHEQMLAGPKRHCRLGEDILVASFLQPGIEGRGHGCAYIRGRRFLAGLSLWPLVLHDLHYAVAVRNVLINRKLVSCPDADDEGNCHARGQAKNVDEGEAPVLAQLAEGDEKIVSEHALAFRIEQNRSWKRTNFFTA